MKTKKKGKQCEYSFIIKSAREEMAFALFCVPYQHFLKQELAKKRSFDFCKLAVRVANYLSENFPESRIIPLEFEKKIKIKP